MTPSLEWLFPGLMIGIAVFGTFRHRDLAYSIQKRAEQREHGRRNLPGPFKGKAMKLRTAYYYVWGGVAAATVMAVASVISILS